MAESRFIFSGKPGRSGWRGEPVLPFDDRSRDDRSISLRSTPPTMASGRLKGLLIQDREDRHKVDCATVVMETQSKVQALEARDWAAAVGFTVEQQPFAAIAAVMLRSSLGAGNVSKAMVLERCQAQHPDLFGELATECAA